MRALLVTGKLAYPILREAVKQSQGDVDILVLDYPVASLMSVRYILENLRLRKEELKEYDFVILPGLVYGDAKVIERELGVKVYKGTENAWDVVHVLEALRRGVSLSTLVPADRILEKEMKSEQGRILSEIESKAIIAFEAGVKIPLRPPPFRVFLELDPSWSMEKWEEELKRVKPFVDVIVAGFPVGFDDPEEVRRRIRHLLDLGLVVGIDSDSPRVIKEGVRTGATFAFNLNELNIDDLEEVKGGAAFVVAPFSTDNRAGTVIELVNMARRKGFTRLMADPILSPPLTGMVDSLVEYLKIRDSLPDVPLLMGTLNVTELIDADSHGASALVVSMAGEIGASSLLVMEKGKTRWNSWEVKVASQMVSIAMYQRKPPKDVGPNLLILKEKKRKLERPQRVGELIEVGRIEPNMDPAGHVKVYVEDRRIGVSFFGKRELTVEGKDALSVGRKLLMETEISREHALYIGYELAKAEIASLLDKTYIQDKPLFRRIADDSLGSQDQSFPPQ